MRRCSNFPKFSWGRTPCRPPFMHYFHFFSSARASIQTQIRHCSAESKFTVDPISLSVQFCRQQLSLHANQGGILFRNCSETPAPATLLHCLTHQITLLQSRHHNQPPASWTFLISPRRLDGQTHALDFDQGMARVYPAEASTTFTTNRKMYNYMQRQPRNQARIRTWYLLLPHASKFLGIPRSRKVKSPNLNFGTLHISYHFSGQRLDAVRQFLSGVPSVHYRHF